MRAAIFLGLLAIAIALADDDQPMSQSSKSTIAGFLLFLIILDLFELIAQFL